MAGCYWWSLKYIFLIFKLGFYANEARFGEQLATKLTDFLCLHGPSSRRVACILLHSRTVRPQLLHVNTANDTSNHGVCVLDVTGLHTAVLHIRDL